MGCILLLGFTTGTGLACTEIQQSAVSGALGKIGGWISDFFKGEGGPSSPAPSEPFDPISSITEAWSTVSSASETVFGAVSTGYKWIEKKENSEWTISFLKNFWDFSFVKNIVFNLHLTIRAWLGILFDITALSKFPDAVKTFMALATALSTDESQTNGEKTMINWLYVRFFVNPRRMLTALKRGAKNLQSGGGKTLKECNGPPKKGQKKLGSCFICKSSKKLDTDMTNFLKEGKMPEADKKEE